MHTPHPDALRFAAEWLRQYDDTHEGGEQTALAEQIAKWLDAQAEAKEERDLARQHGVSVQRFRSKIAEVMSRITPPAEAA